MYDKKCSFLCDTDTKQKSLLLIFQKRHDNKGEQSLSISDNQYNFQI